MAKKREKRTNKMDVLEHLYCDICNGYPRFQLKIKLQEDSYGLGTDKLTEKSHDTYLKEAYDMCKVEKQEDLEKLRDVQYNRLLSVYNQAVMARDNMSAIAAIKEMNRVFGVEAPVKQEIKADIEQKIILDFGFETDDSDNESETY